MRAPSLVGISEKPLHRKQPTKECKGEDCQLTLQRWEEYCSRIVTILVALLGMGASLWTIGSCSLFQTSFLVYSDLPNEPARIDSWHVVYVGLFRFSTTNGAFLGMGSSDVCHPYNALEGSPGWETLSTNPLFQAAQGISMASPCAAAFATLLLIPVRCRVPLWIIGLLYAASTACQIASLILLQSVDFCLGDDPFGDCELSTGSFVSFAAAALFFLSILCTWMVGRYQQNTDRLVSYNTVDARPDLEQGKVEDQVENSENDSIHLNGGAPNMDDETRYPDYHDDTLNTTTQQEICSVYSEVDKIMWSSVMSTLSGGSETFFLHRGEVSAPSAPGVVNVVAAASTMLPRELSPVKRNYEDISIVDMDVTVSDSSLYISTDMGENSYEEEENGILLYQSIETQDSLETDCMAHTMPSESNYKVTTVVGESNQNAPGEELSTIADNLSLDSAQRLETQDGPEDEYSQLSAPSESNNVNPTVAIESNQNDAGDELLPIADNLSVDSAQKLETQERSEDEDAQLSVPSESNNVIATEMGESNQNGAGDELLPIEDKLSVDSAQGLESQEGVEDKDASRSSPSESSNVIAAVAEETNQNGERVEQLLTDNEQSVNSAQRLESQEGVEEEDALCSSHSEGINEITTVEDKSTDDVLRDELGTDEVKRSSDSESQDDDNESSGILVWEDHNDDKTPFEGDEEVQTGDDVSRQQFQRCTDLLEEMKTEDQEDYRENYDVPLTNIYHQLPENMTNYGLDDDHPTNADTEEKEPRLGNNDNGNTLTGS